MNDLVEDSTEKLTTLYLLSLKDNTQLFLEC